MLSLGSGWLGRLVFCTSQVISWQIVFEMTCSVSSCMLNPTIPYHAHLHTGDHRLLDEAN